jgi:ELWxxDGT repeat protein
MNFRPTAPSQAQALTTSGNPEPAVSSLFAQEKYLTPDGKKLYFTVRSDSYGGATPSVEERWVTDGTVAGTSKVGNALYSGKNYLYGRIARDFKTIGNGDRFIYKAGEGIWSGNVDGSNLVQLKEFDAVPGHKQPDLPSGAIVNQTQNGTVFFTGDELGPNSISLWKSNGTVAGTVKIKELQPRVYGSYNSYNSYTTETVAFGNTLYFTVGNGAVQNNEFWQTNALNNETRLVDFFQGKIDSLSSRNQKLFFSGKANDGRQGWWLSDGNTAGTKFLGDFTMLPARNTSGLIQNDAFYFIAKAKDGRQGLWVTNINTATTQLLIELPTNSFSGGYGSSQLNVETSANRTYIWINDEKSDVQGIWETNGTSEGTRKIAFNDAERNAAIKQYGKFLKIQDRIYFATSENKPGSNDDKLSIWDLNPTATQPWATLTGYAIDAGNILKVNNNLYLSGRKDEYDQYVQASQGLFKLDSTTGAIIQVATTVASGGWQKLGDRLIFQPDDLYYDYDYSSQWSTRSKWNSIESTDGTTTVTLLDPRSLVPGLTPVAKPTLLLGQNLNTLSNDWAIKGTLKSNTLAHNQTTGEVAVFNPAGQKTSIYTVSDTNWQIKGIADLNGDGEQDLFWQHKASGQTAIWNLKNQAIASGTFLISVTDPNWKVEGFADMDKDGKTDVLWQHKTQGTFAYWKMDGNSIKSGVYLPSAPDLNWSVKGLADFDKDGDMDILWQNDSTGEVKLWRLENNKVAYTVNLATVADRNWQIRGVADMDRDGQYDLLWTNTATREVAFWSWAGDDAWKKDYQAYVSPEDLATGDPSKWTYNFYKSVTPRGTYLNRLKANEIDAIGIV